MKEPKITKINYPAPNTTDTVEVFLEWEGEYASMLSFKIEDINNGELESQIQKHIKSIKRLIDFNMVKQELEARAAIRAKMEEMQLEIMKLKVKAEEAKNGL